MQACGRDGLAETLVYLPTRRAGRALSEAFLARERALILPEIRTLGDLEEDEAGWLDEPDDTAIAPAISPLRRRLELTELIRRWHRQTGPGEIAADHAANLAQELARLIDELQIEQVGFEALARLVPDPLAEAEHWQTILAILDLARREWPRRLSELGLLDPAERRNRLALRQIERWRDLPPATPVVIAGTTGSVPATAGLIQAAMTLPQGHLVLPGLDRHVPDEEWQALAPTHPQFGLKNLLDRLGVSRQAVADWPAAPESPRIAFLSRAMGSGSPASTPAVAGPDLIECRAPDDEAACVALLLRETLESPGRRAAFVTADRALARRVSAKLKRWGIEADDSAGTSLLETLPGAFLRLAEAAVRQNFAPVPLMALMKHPLAQGGLAPGEFRRRARRLEELLFRREAMAPGWRHFSDSLRKAAPGSEGETLARWIACVLDGAQPFLALGERNRAPISELVAAHAQWIEQLAATDALPGELVLWAGPAGEALAQALGELQASTLDPIEPAAYGALLGALLDRTQVRLPFARHPRLAILGVLEARLLSFDRVILGGLNEGSWPPEPAADPWLSRKMREAGGLSSPERRIGQSAHDFVQLCALPEAILTRALRVDGTPRVASRFVERLKAAQGEESPQSARSRILACVGALEGVYTYERATAPSVKPPFDARPRRLSVTRIDALIRNPYEVYARDILRLRELPPLAFRSDGALRGTLFHRALELFAKRWPWPETDAERLALLHACGREAFGDFLAIPAIRAFWWPQFETIADWVVEHERAYPAVSVVAEASGCIERTIAGRLFTLTGKADRIDLLPGERCVIVDFKTGTLPSKRSVMASEVLQLPLEAAMVEACGFPGIIAPRVARLEYWRLSLSGRGPGTVCIERGDLPERALARLDCLVAKFDDPNTAYEARKSESFNPYAHLAREKAWAEAPDGETENGESETE